jgi:hypothetical protein
MSGQLKCHEHDSDERKIELGNIARPDVADGSVLETEIGGVKHEETNEQIVSQAIESIGMGRYQWSLAASCGFGFLVDQVRARRFL